MSPIDGRLKKPGRGFVLLAPQRSRPAIGRIMTDRSRHSELLSAAQRLRGSIYLEDGAIDRGSLTEDGRHVQPADEVSWHLLTVENGTCVTACIRYLAHAPGVSFSELGVSRSPAAQAGTLKNLVREGIEQELEAVRRKGFSYVELGGWAISPHLRCTLEAVNTLVTVYALSRVLGGAHGLSTATTRHRSSSILKRIGGAPLSAHGTEVPSYYDPHYGCEMELLRFDSDSPNPRYAGWIQNCCTALRDVPVIAGESDETCTSSLLNLQNILGDKTTSYQNVFTATKWHTQDSQKDLRLAITH